MTVFPGKPRLLGFGTVAVGALALIAVVSFTVDFRFLSNTPHIFLRDSLSRTSDDQPFRLPEIQDLRLPPLDLNASIAKLDPPAMQPAKPLIAHCVTGHPRTLYYNEVSKLYRVMMEDLDATNALFMVLDDTYASNAHEKIPKNMTQPRTRYRKAIASLKPTKVVWLGAQDKKKWPQWVHERMKRNRYWEMFFKREMCWRLVKEYERRSGIEFSHIISTRPDVILPKGLGQAKLFSNEKIWVGAYNEYLNKDEYFDAPISRALGTGSEVKKRGFVTDIVAIVPRVHANTFFNQILRLKGSVKGPRGKVAGDVVQKVLIDRSNLWKYVEEHPIMFKLRRPFIYCKKRAPSNRHLSWC